MKVLQWNSKSWHLEILNMTKRYDASSWWASLQFMRKWFELLCFCFHISTRTAWAIGIIMAVVAVLLSHMDKKPVTMMKPSNSLKNRAHADSWLTPARIHSEKRYCNEGWARVSEPASRWPKVDIPPYWSRSLKARLCIHFGIWAHASAAAILSWENCLIAYIQLPAERSTR